MRAQAVTPVRFEADLFAPKRILEDSPLRRVFPQS
jgi:hypothetical protein